MSATYAEKVSACVNEAIEIRYVECLERRPCACCGYEAIETVRLGTQNWEPRRPYRIACRNCGLRTEWCETSMAARRIWNRRPWDGDRST